MIERLPRPPQNSSPSTIGSVFLRYSLSPQASSSLFETPFLGLRSYTKLTSTVRSRSLIDLTGCCYRPGDRVPNHLPKLSILSRQPIARAPPLSADHAEYVSRSQADQLIG